MRMILKNTGLSGLWRCAPHALRVSLCDPCCDGSGNGAAMWRVMPHSGIVFMTFDRYEQSLKMLLADPAYLPVSNVGARFLAGLPPASHQHPTSLPPASHQHLLITTLPQVLLLAPRPPW